MWFNYLHHFDSCFLLQEKDLIHKLFKVLVPRYQNYSTSFTQMWNLPIKYPGFGHQSAVLELKGTSVQCIPQDLKAGKEGDILINNALDTFYLRLYGVGNMVKDHSDDERRNLLLFPISSKCSFKCNIPQTG